MPILLEQYNALVQRTKEFVLKKKKKGNCGLYINNNFGQQSSTREGKKKKGLIAILVAQVS